jgi:hypothetical protein
MGDYDEAVVIYAAIAQDHPKNTVGAERSASRKLRMKESTLLYAHVR